MYRSGKRYIPLRTKLLASYILLILFPIIIIGSYTYYKTASSAEQEMRNNLAVALTQYRTQVDFRVNDIIRSSDAIFEDQVLSRNLSGYYLGGERHRIMTQYILPKMESAVLLPNTEVMISLYLDKPTIGEFYYEEREEDLRDGSRVYGIMYSSRIKDQEWYKNLNLMYDEKLWEQVGVDKQYDNISLLRNLIDYEILKKIGIIKITVKMRDVFEDFDLSNLGEGTKLIVVDHNQQYLYSSDMSEEEYDPSLLQSSEQYLQMTEDIDSVPFQLIALVPKKSLREGSLQVRNITILICFISLLVAVLISFIISKFFTLRFSKLVYSLQAFTEGDFNKRIYYRGQDEFGQISDAFNEMASTIQKQIDELYISKLETKEAELQILHAQINPHFLYNTFSSISRMAKLGEVDKLNEMILKLAKFYRLTLNKGEMIIPISKEIEIIKAYLDIQNLKYGDRIVVTYEIDDLLLEQETVKFILQPFVENVLEHAWYDDQIHIRLAISREEDRIILAIEDNGLGMPEHTIKGIIGTSESAIGYGIRNVDQRIKLHYGAEYGVYIESVVGEGTVIKLMIPYAH
ncbi:MAG: sensor histidine kinase [Candidatus Pristimantibacillus lignocellulolyticus]|uniref:histidine kinase n=1 Tax=Candidatus Pristimantibacillus lignocellulolyticus TaxID=2994561 RepID=A0A9J6ZJ58_9BACL|nr:MAG: sensor histidine kinase [Candidatus Pristimantibacillus lignocellulolyticus]